jgi:hypothetical protein
MFNVVKLCVSSVYLGVVNVLEIVIMSRSLFLRNFDSSYGGALMLFLSMI